MVELMTGLFALCVFLKFGLHVQTLIYFLFIARAHGDYLY